MCHEAHQDQGIGSTLTAADDSNQLGCGATLERQIPLTPSKVSLRHNAIFVSDPTQRWQVPRDSTGTDSNKKATRHNRGEATPIGWRL